MLYCVHRTFTYILHSTYISTRFNNFRLFMAHLHAHQKDCSLVMFGPCCHCHYYIVYICPLARIECANDTFSVNCQTNRMVALSKHCELIFSKNLANFKRNTQLEVLLGINMSFRWQHTIRFVFVEFIIIFQWEFFSFVCLFVCSFIVILLLSFGG